MQRTNVDGLTVKDEGIAQGTPGIVTVVDFVGAGVTTAVNDALATATVTIAGGGGGGSEATTVTDTATVNLTLTGTAGSADVIQSGLTLSDIGGAVTDAQVPNTITLDNITQVTTRSHTSLTDIGTNAHTAIDTHLAATNPHTGSAPVAATYITQTADATLTAEQPLSALATGVVKVTTTTGVLSTAVSGTDFETPGVSATHAALTAAHGATGAVVGTTNTQTLTGKTLTTPTIADFTNAGHTHAAAASGGTIAHTALTSIGTNTHAQIDTHVAATGTAAHGLGTMSTQASIAVAVTGGTVTGITDLAVADGGTGASDAATARTNLAAASSTQTGVMTFIVDGGGSAITTGIKGDVYFPFAATITGWTILLDQSGSIVFDLWEDTYTLYPPTLADTITATAKPTVSAAIKGQSSVLTGWTPGIAADSSLRINVDSITTASKATLSLTFTRTV